MKRLVVAAVALMAVAWAGCAETEDAASEASLNYNGDAAGKHDERANCEHGTAQLTGGGSVNAGALRVEVVDSNGAQLFGQTYSDGWEFDGEGLSGAGGTWHLSAERQEGFAGQYSFVLICS
jgi:hypothetical protein